jgi:hypothetical protein
MFTTPATSHATEILRNIANLLNALAQDVEICDLSLLDSIAATASQLAQNVHIENDALLAQCDEREALAADLLMTGSDALDHSIGW